MPITEIKIIIPSGDWRRGSPMDLQDPLEEALSEAGLGEITRGGAAPGHFFLVAEVSDEVAALPLLRRILQEHGVPSRTRIETDTESHSLGEA